MDKNSIFKHNSFGELNTEDLNSILDFASTVLNKLTRFEVWEAENIFDEDDDSEWNECAIETFLEIDKLRVELEDKLHGFEEVVCEHDKIYSEYILLSNPPMREWRCVKCEEHGRDVIHNNN